jgi:hypothetical protein
MLSRWRVGSSGGWLSFANTARRGWMMKSSGFFPISTMSACFVIAQNGSNSGRSYQKTGAC